MTVAQVVKPSVRSTRGTRESSTLTKDAHIEKTKEPMNDKRDRPNRPSTRGVKATGSLSVQKPRRTASTRNGSVGRPVSPSTRVRASTRAIPTRSVKENTKKTEPFSLKAFVFNNVIKRPESHEPETEAIPSGPRPSRTQVYGQKREIKRNTAPLQFVLAMFFVVIASVLAFGLLRGDPMAQQPDRPDTNEQVIYQKPGTTSTNTGILRGH